MWGRGGVSTPPLAKEELGKGRKERLGGTMGSVKPPIAQGLVGFSCEKEDHSCLKNGLIFIVNWSLKWFKIHQKSVQI